MLLKPGDPAPSFVLESLEGPPQAIESLWAVAPVVLAFFKSACPTCQLSFPYLGRLRSTATRVVGISQDSATVTRAFAARFGVQFPLLLDSEDDNYPASNAFGIHHVPTLFVIGAGGLITERIEAFDKAAFEQLGVIFTPEDHVPLYKPG